MANSSMPYFRHGGWPRFRLTVIEVPGAFEGSFSARAPLLVWLAFHSIRIDESAGRARVDLEARIRGPGGERVLRRPCVVSTGVDCLELLANPENIEGRVRLERGKYSYRVEARVVEGSLRGEALVSLVMVPATGEVMGWG